MKIIIKHLSKTIGILLIAVSTLQCSKKDELPRKPDWEITQLTWKVYGLNYLEVKVKNNSGKTSDILSIQILLKSGSTIKDDGLYMHTGPIIPEREYTFRSDQSGIQCTDVELLNYQSYTASLGEVTVLYK